MIDRKTAYDAMDSGPGGNRKVARAIPEPVFAEREGPLLVCGKI